MMEEETRQRPVSKNGKQAVDETLDPEDIMPYNLAYDTTGEEFHLLLG